MSSPADTNGEHVSVSPPPGGSGQSDASPVTYARERAARRRGLTRARDEEDPTVVSAIAEAKTELANDLMWVRDDLRGELLEQASEIKRLQAVVWVLAQLTAENVGVSPDDLASRIAKAVADVGGPPGAA